MTIVIAVIVMLCYDTQYKQRSANCTIIFVYKVG